MSVPIQVDEKKLIGEEEIEQEEIESGNESSNDDEPFRGGPDFDILAEESKPSDDDNNAVDLEPKLINKEKVD